MATATTAEMLVRRSIHRFDVFSLLALLEYMGYRMDQVQFKSHATNCSQPCLLQDIEFKKEPVQQAVITINMGLLGPQSPLPSYFMKRLEKGLLDVRLFLDFIGYFDHSIIFTYLQSIYPEGNPLLFPDWEEAVQYRLLMLSLRSCSTLEWMLRLAVPELGVYVEKAEMKRSLRTEQIALGKTALGSDAVFGRRSSVPVYGLRATFYADEERTGAGRLWLREVRKRLTRLVFPTLRRVGVDIEIFLVIRSHRSWARLQHESYLGYDVIRGGKEQYQRLLVFSGYLIDR